MSEIANIDGFKVFEENTLIIQDGNIQECMAFFKKKNLNRIWISRFHGYTANNVDFLKDYNFLKQVVLNGPFDITGLYYLSKLEYLSYNNLNKGFTLDLKQFSKITTFYVDLKSKVINLDSLELVKDVRLFNYLCKKKNLMSISNFKDLESLYISLSNIESLSGIERLAKLKNIEFHYLKKLTHINQLTSINKSIDCLIISNSKKIMDFESLRELHKLRILGLSNCGSISTINFLNDLPKLSDFRFVNTNILDGDLSPLLRLNYAGFLNKRHYSHTYENLALLHGHS